MDYTCISGEELVYMWLLKSLYFQFIAQPSELHMKIQSENYLSTQSSCYTLDIRNSTSIIRSITYGGKGINKDKKRLVIHAELMMRIHEFLINRLEQLGIKDYYFDNSGDGHMCLLWNKIHGWTMIDIVCSLSVFVDKMLKEYKKNYLDKWSADIEKTLVTGFGIGIHSAGSLVYHHDKIGRQFGYGSVLNSSNRVESFTKNFDNLNLLFTGNFKSFLSKQFKMLPEKEQERMEHYKEKIIAVTSIRSDVKDSRGNGHLLYTIQKKEWKYFIKK